METTRTVVAIVTIIFAIGYFVLEHKLNKRRQARERKFIDWMQGRGPYPEDKP